MYNLSNIVFLAGVESAVSTLKRFPARQRGAESDAAFSRRANKEQFARMLGEGLLDQHEGEALSILAEFAGTVPDAGGDHFAQKQAGNSHLIAVNNAVERFMRTATKQVLFWEQVALRRAGKEVANGDEGVVGVDNVVDIERRDDVGSYDGGEAPTSHNQKLKNFGAGELIEALEELYADLGAFVATLQSNIRDFPEYEPRMLPLYLATREVDGGQEWDECLTIEEARSAWQAGQAAQFAKQERQSAAALSNLKSFFK